MTLSLKYPNKFVKNSNLNLLALNTKKILISCSCVCVCSTFLKPQAAAKKSSNVINLCVSMSLNWCQANKPGKDSSQVCDRSCVCVCVSSINTCVCVFELVYRNWLLESIASRRFELLPGNYNHDHYVYAGLEVSMWCVEMRIGEWEAERRCGKRSHYQGQLQIEWCGDRYGWKQKCFEFPCQRRGWNQKCFMQMSSARP